MKHWDSEYFRRTEFACKCGCGFDTVDAELINILDKLRSKVGRLKVNSGSRCPAYNKKIGGRPTSQHLYGRAADVVGLDCDQKKVQEALIELNPKGLGIYKSFSHVDTRSGPRARW